MKRSFIILLVLFSGFSGFSQHKLEKLWETDSVFKVPESVLFDAKNNRLYVTNIDGTDPWGADGTGSVGLMDVNGSVIAAEWVSGLNAPKGMGLYNDKLFVADLNELIVINRNTGFIETAISVPGAAGLNDVAIDGGGVIYVSDSKLKKVFRVENGKAEVYLENLKGPNGLMIEDKTIYLLDAGGLYRVGDDKSLVKITDGMDGGTDGVEKINKTDFIISCWAGAVWYVSGNGDKELLLDGKKDKMNTADIGFDPKTNTVFVPTFWRNTVTAFKVK